ncbi:hypothetical protein EGU60_16745 [Acinetobacter baumannii]|nr:hypothetical protein EGU26_17930 [Acinetobacter baumannii]RSH28867.1 hypothetical protein EGU60_16745 [Acinetobacter baumannii]RSH52056.1 hypothetical protein EGU58_12570 [Acinetobacter baumannii]
MNNEYFKLYTDSQFLSPYAFTVFVGLHEKQIPFEIAAIDLGQQGQFETSFVEKSLTAKVPVLEHNDFALSESSAILEYFSVHDKFHRTLILSGFCLLKIAKISLNSSFFPKPIKR